MNATHWASFSGVFLEEIIYWEKGVPYIKHDGYCMESRLANGEKVNA